MTVETLLQIMPRCPKPWANAIITALPEYDIDMWQRQSAFIAQLAHESSELTRLEENLNYSADGLRKIFPKYFPNDALAKEYARKPELIANMVYSNRMGNGNYESGDGWRFRGRGPFQLTGKDNYTKCGVAIKRDLIASPELLLEPAVGIESACWYWTSRGLNPLADIGDFVTITKRINGGLIGIEDRERYYEKAKGVLQ